MCNKDMAHLKVNIQIHRTLVVWSVVRMLKFILAVSDQIIFEQKPRSFNKRSDKELLERGILRLKCSSEREKDEAG